MKMRVDISWKMLLPNSDIDITCEGVRVEGLGSDYLGNLGKMQLQNSDIDITCACVYVGGGGTSGVDGWVGLQAAPAHRPLAQHLATTLTPHPRWHPALSPKPQPSPAGSPCRRCPWGWDPKP